MTPDGAAARAVFDPEGFQRQTGGDADLRAEIVQMFLEDCPARVEEIRAADLERLARERRMDDAPALLEHLDAAVAALLTELRTINR